jgi:hypothetical protein
MMPLLDDAKTSLRRMFWGRRMTTAERRRRQLAAANDPRVDRAVREAIASRPGFRRKAEGSVGVSHRDRP